MQGVELKPKNIAIYAALPGVFPRLKTLFGQFYYLPIFLATLYKNMGLLPPAHPYLNTQNHGRFGVMALIGVVANELTFDRKNIDKIIVFGLTVLTFVLFVLFAFGLVFSFVSNHAHALAAFLTVASPNTEISFEILDRIFGVPGIYNSGYAASAPAFPTPFQTGLHSMLELYSAALFILATLFFLYYTVSIVAETALHGTPFGQRFHRIWGPLRLVIALGLLVPSGFNGLNSAQYILLYVAKWGSSVATNAWIAFNASPGVISPFGTGVPMTVDGPDRRYTDINGNPYTVPGVSYQSNGLVVHPQSPDVSSLVAYINLIHTCVYAYKQMYNIDIKPYFVQTQAGAGLSQEATAAFPTFYGTGDIYIYFGHKSVADYPKAVGNVRAYCGELIVPYKQIFSIAGLNISLTTQYYTDIMRLLLINNPLALSPNVETQGPQTFGYKIVAHKLFGKGHNNITPCGLTSPYTALGPCNDPELRPNHRAFSISEFSKTFDAGINAVIAGLISLSPSPFEPTPAHLAQGWVIAGLWYSKLAEWNGDIIASVAAVPHPGKFPEIMEHVRKYRLSTNQNVDSLNVFQPIADGKGNVVFDNPIDRQIHSALLAAYEYWNADGASDPRNIASKANPFENSLASIFGLSPIMTIREQDHVHPLAQLAAVGKTLIENSITNLALAAGASFIGGVMNAGGEGLGSAFTGMSGFFVALSYIGILLGLILYYIIPFMPFLYSFFAASGWIKSIFEGMVGVPLWALAHMKLKGDSIFSREAVGGYYLLLEIFIRPMLILFGLMASTAVFAASISVLNNIWDLVTDNVTGITIETAALSDPLTMGYYRNIVDQFFFLVIYIIVVYLIGTSSFKLIDQIPHSVVRWINASVKSFGDMAHDPAEGLYEYASVATYRFGPAIGQGVSGASEALGGAIGGATGLGGAVAPNVATNVGGFGKTASRLGGGKKP